MDSRAGDSDAVSGKSIVHSVGCSMASFGEDKRTYTSQNSNSPKLQLGVIAVLNAMHIIERCLKIG